MKKTLAILLAFVLLLATAGCSTCTAPAPSEAAPNPDSSGTIQVGIVQLADNGAFTDIAGRLYRENARAWLFGR